MARNKNKPIIETDKPGGKIIQYWRSARAAADHYGFGNQIIISYNVNGRTKQAKGHYFRFATPQEIRTYEEIQRKISVEKSTEPTPIVVEQKNNLEQVETIPETVEKTDDQANTLSAFDRLLQLSKKKFDENSH